MKIGSIIKALRFLVFDAILDLNKCGEHELKINYRKCIVSQGNVVLMSQVVELKISTLKV